jgi:predicted O-methyltransferase YrrM
MASLYRRLIDEGIRRTFSLWEQLGFHVTPNHFYQPIPDTRRLPETLWTRRSEMVGVDLGEPAQLALLAELSAAYEREWAEFPAEPGPDPWRFHFGNVFFESVDAEIYHGLIRRHRPRRIVEIGSGSSTYLAAQAVCRNEAEGHPCDLVAIEPYPNPVLSRGFPGLTRLVTAQLQSIPLDEFTTLGDGDVLFIDSSHVLRIGSDVQYEFLEILPRLRPGVLVHVHDVFLPDEYPRGWVMDEHRFWNEQYLLQAFLAFNRAFEVVWAGSFMNARHSGLLAAAIPSYRQGETVPGSFWMRRRR